MKLKYEDIVEEVEKEGWELLTPTYTNLKTDMSFKCPAGHTNFYSFEKWRRGHVCVTCKNNPLFNVNQNPVKKQGFRILAFDQATNTSGWSVFDDEKLISYGNWTAEGNHTTEKIGQTKYWVASMIEKWKPDFIVLEDIQLQKFDKKNGGESAAVETYKKLAQLQGVLKNYIFEIGIPYEIAFPATWRAYSQVKGQNRTDKKRSAQLIVKKKYDIDVTQDEADAILIGTWGAHEHKATQIISFV